MSARVIPLEDFAASFDDYLHCMVLPKLHPCHADVVHDLTLQMSNAANRDDAHGVNELLNRIHGELFEEARP
jgi:hypothetical protein